MYVVFTGVANFSQLADVRFSSVHINTQIHICKSFLSLEIVCIWFSNYPKAIDVANFRPIME